MGLIFDENMARLYDTWYHSSEGQAIDRSIEALILSLLEPRPGERVLDIGCGAGNHLLNLGRLGLDVSGIDASPYVIDRARDRLGHRCSLKVGTAEDLPYEDNEFDLAVLINTLEFLNDPLQALREAGRVVNRRIFIGVINSLSWNGLLKKIRGCFKDTLFSRATFFNLWQVKSLVMNAYGRVPISWGCIQIPPPLVDKVNPFSHSSRGRPSPFGSFLGLSATMVYEVRTKNLPLQVRLKKTGETLIGAKTLQDLNRSQGVEQHETGLSV